VGKAEKEKEKFGLGAIKGEGGKKSFHPIAQNLE
jgi:hypothetical protein